MNTKFIIGTFGNLFISLGMGIFIFTYVPIIYSEVLYYIYPPVQSNYISLDNQNVKIEPKKIDDSKNIAPLKPASSEFAILIPKIGVNAPIIPNVSTADQAAYMAALRDGVAHAKGTSLPGEKGNMFLFAHSSLNFWQLGPYATVFNLLNKLERGDIVVVVYKDESYTYQVMDSDIIPGWNTEPFLQDYDEPVLTMITCYPPGTTVNRLVVRARLVSHEQDSQ